MQLCQQKRTGNYEQRIDCTEIENDTKEADIVSARIAKLLQALVSALQQLFGIRLFVLSTEIRIRLQIMLPMPEYRRRSC